MQEKPIPLDRETAEHLADDTGLSPSQLDPQAEVQAHNGSDDQAEHLAQDAGLKKEQLESTAEAPPGLGQALAPPG
ncbi:MAG TPA: hypothetical protein VHL54_03990 [Actinomycetota bacterium]|nr:hypothetical protein [Actinomycetota bacterium]